MKTLKYLFVISASSYFTAPLFAQGDVEERLEKFKTQSSTADSRSIQSAALEQKIIQDIGEADDSLFSRYLNLPELPGEKSRKISIIN